MVKKMSELAKMAMSEREMNSFAGGETCGCACRSVSTMDNGSANVVWLEERSCSQLFF